MATVTRAQGLVLLPEPSWDWVLLCQWSTPGTRVGGGGHKYSKENVTDESSPPPLNSCLS